MASNNATNNATPNVAAHSVLISEAGSPVVGVLLATGQTLVGVTGSDPVASTLTALQWVDVAGTTQAAAVNTGYIISNASQTTVTLPATAAEGSVIAIAGKGAAGWIMTANSGQTIKLGTQTTSTAGTLTSTAQYDCIEIVCVAANVTWVARNVQGNITYA